MDYCDSYTDVFECKPNIHPIELLHLAIDKCLIIPHKEIQKKILIAAAITPSEYASVLPLVIAYGQSGTGKSVFGKAVHGLWGLHDEHLFAGKTTAVALRNAIMLQKHGNYWMEEIEDLPTEKSAVLIWDDINPNLLKDETVLSMLKSGYSRKSANLSISREAGKNLSFNCFCSKFTSTIHPIWAIDELKELKRRILVFPYKKWNEMSVDELENNPSIDEVEDIDYISFEGYKASSHLYLDPDELIQLKAMVPKLRSKLRSANFPKDFGKLNFDLIRIATLLGTFQDLNDAIKSFEDFYQLQEETLKEKTEFQFWIDAYLDKQIGEQSQLIQVKAGVSPMEISRSKLDLDIQKAMKNRDIPWERRNIQMIMKERGWKLVNENGSNTFVKEVGTL